MHGQELKVQTSLDWNGVSVSVCYSFGNNSDSNTTSLIGLSASFLHTYFHLPVERFIFCLMSIYDQ